MNRCWSHQKIREFNNETHRFLLEIWRLFVPQFYSGKHRSCVYSLVYTFIHVHWQWPHETHWCTIFFNNLHEWFKYIKNLLYITCCRLYNTGTVSWWVYQDHYTAKQLHPSVLKNIGQGSISKLVQESITTVTVHVRHCLVQSDYNSLCK